MGLLPSLRWGNARWWLPLGATTADRLAALMLTPEGEVALPGESGGEVKSGRLGEGNDAGRVALPGESGGEVKSLSGNPLTLPLSPAARGEREPAVSLRGCLEFDPAFRLWAALEWLADHPQQAAERLEADLLCQWLAPRLVDRFAAADRFLGAPPLQREQRSCWQRLLERDDPAAEPFDADPLRDGARWLEVAGPPTPLLWRRQWPQLVGIAAEEEIEEPEEVDPEDVEQRERERPEREWPEATVDRSPANGEAAASCPAARAVALAYGTVRTDLSELARCVRDRRELTERFGPRLEGEKRAALHQLAYGLSHEINNPLANIVTRAGSLARDEAQPRRRERLEAIIAQAMRAHEMIADLMYYARPPLPQRRRFDLAARVRRVARAAAERCEPLDIRLRVTCEGKPPEGEPPEGTCRPIWVVGDADALGDALAALVDNAIEAIGCGGEIAVAVDRRGEVAEIIVADNGPGLSAAARRHAFDPYFSGREAGRGLGLGLCRVERIAQAHGGGARLEPDAVGCRARLWIDAGPS